MQEIPWNDILPVKKFLEILDAKTSSHATRWAAETCIGRAKAVQFLDSLEEYARKYMICVGEALPLRITSNDAIQCAANDGHLEVLKFLCSLDAADPTSVDNCPLRSACQHGHLGIVQFLCSLHTVDPASPRNLPIRIAAANGRLDIVKFLSSRRGVNAGDRDNDAICCAAENGHLEVLKFLVSMGGGDMSESLASVVYADAIFKTSSSSNIKTERRRSEVMVYLIGLNRVLLPSNIMISTLYSAAHQGHTDLVKALVRLDGMKAACTNAHVVLQAARNGHLEVVRVLLALDGAEPSGRALVIASRNGHLEVVDCLLHSCCVLLGMLQYGTNDPRDREIQGTNGTTNNYAGVAHPMCAEWCIKSPLLWSLETLHHWFAVPGLYSALATLTNPSKKTLEMLQCFRRYRQDLHQNLVVPFQHIIPRVLSEWMIQYLVGAE